MIEISADQLSQSLGIGISNLQPEPVGAGGLHSRVYACNSEIGDLVLRVCEGQQGFYTQYFPDMVDSSAWIDQAWAVTAARSTGVPAPELIHSDRAQCWSVMKRLPGIPIDSDYESWDRCPYDEKDFGAILGRLHRIRPTGYGSIDDHGRALFSSWPSFLVEAACSAFRTCLARGSLSLSLVEQLEKHWLPQLHTAELATPSLLHMESLGFANLMYDPGDRTITGLLDYEDCIGGDPLFEVCWMRYYFDHDSPDQPYFNFDRFAAGYGELPSTPERMALYSPFPLLDKLRWIEQEGSRTAEYIRRLDTFARQCQ